MTHDLPTRNPLSAQESNAKALNPPFPHPCIYNIVKSEKVKATKEIKSEFHTSVNINEDTMTTYARKKKTAICMKNFGFSLMFGDVTALAIR